MCRRVEYVGVWLGKAREHSHLIMDKMADWTAEYDRLLRENHGDWELAAAAIPPSNPVFYNAEGRRDPFTRSAWYALLERDWWQRAWIVQEATVLSPSRTFVFCGTKMVGWLSIRTALHIGHRAGQYELYGISVTYSQGEGLRLDQFRMNREDGDYIRFLVALELIRSLECEDPRDKVYECLVMAADVLESEIIPDYTKSVEEVYVDVVRYFLTREEPHSLDFLGSVVRLSPEYPLASHFPQSDLPSWVPDWTLQCSLYAFEKYLEVGAYSSERAYNASSGLSCRVSMDGRRLYLSGMEVDTISEVLPECWENLADSRLRIERGWMPKEPGKPYALGGTVGDAFNHSLVAGLRRMHPESGALSRNCVADWPLIDRDPFTLRPEEGKMRFRLLVDLKMTTFGKRLFRTTKGFLGLGPAAAQHGDIVSLLLGVQVLYVLRSASEDDHCEFVGECYVHGLMDGQAVNALMEGREM
jgi:hypothetical protein